MARVNKKKSGYVDRNTKLNHEGEVVHQLNTLETLFSKVLGSFFGEGTFYEDKDTDSVYEELKELVKNVPEKDKEYVLKIARLGREHNMITYPLALLTVCMNDERFKYDKFVDEVIGKNKLQTYTKYIVKRSKDILDILAMQEMNEKTFNFLAMPMQMRKGLKERIEYFNEYKLSKYLGKGNSVSLADAIKLLHPKGSKSKCDFYKRVIENRVVFGNDVKQIQSELTKKGDNYDDLKDSIKKSSLLSVLKNLTALKKRGLLEDKNVVEDICSMLTNKDIVVRSRLLPFRFYSAYIEMSHFVRYTYKEEIENALVKALDLSIENLPDIEGKTVIVIDVSGSMCDFISNRSNMMAKNVAILLGIICSKKSNADVYIFASQCEKVNVPKRLSVIDSMEYVLNGNVGGGTYLDKALDKVMEEGGSYDNLIILSDGDCYSRRGEGFSFNSAYHYFSSGRNIDEYIDGLMRKGRIKNVYMNNLLGNDFAVINTESFRKNLITGFSERIVEMINIYSSLGQKSGDIRNVIDGLLKE